MIDRSIDRRVSSSSLWGSMMEMTFPAANDFDPTNKSRNIRLLLGTVFRLVFRVEMRHFFLSNSKVENIFIAYFIKCLKISDGSFTMTLWMILLMRFRLLIIFDLYAAKSYVRRSVSNFTCRTDIGHPSLPTECDGRREASYLLAQLTTQVYPETCKYHRSEYRTVA